jgi:hypothetical protein
MGCGLGVKKAAGHTPAAGIALALPRLLRFWTAQAHFPWLPL